MKSIKTVSIVFLIFLAAVASADLSATKQKISAIYSRLDGLAVKMDTKALEKAFVNTMTPDYMLTDTTGAKHSGNDSVKQMISQFQMFSAVSLSTSHIDSIEMKGGDYELHVTSKLALSTKPGPDGKVHKIDVNSKSDVIWVRAGSSYKMKSEKLVKQNILVDGKAPGARG